MIAQLLLAVGLAYLTWSLVAMGMKYQRAKSMGIPLVRLPIDPENVIWLVLEPHFGRLLDRLSINWGTFAILAQVPTSAVENERKHDDSMCGIHGYKTHGPTKD